MTTGTYSAPLPAPCLSQQHLAESLFNVPALVREDTLTPAAADSLWALLAGKSQLGVATERAGRLISLEVSAALDLV